MDDWDCLENSCTLRGTVGSNPTLSDHARRISQNQRGERRRSPRLLRGLVAHLHHHCQRQDERVLGNLDDHWFVEVALIQDQCH